MLANADSRWTISGSKKTPNIQVVALDFDGVVVDSMPLQERAWREAACGVLESDAQKDSIVLNLYAGKAHESMFDGIAISKEKRELLRRRKDELWSGRRRTVPLMPGAELIIPLLARSYRLAIATSADRTYVEDVLLREGLRHCISHVVTDADVARPKPAPDMIEALAAHFATEMRRLCMVGDTDSDQDMSDAAGSIFVRFRSPDATRNSRASTTVAESWQHLGQLLGVPLR